jgi:hypothetical protein
LDKNEGQKATIIKAKDINRTLSRFDTNLVKRERTVVTERGEKCAFKK